MQVPNKYEISWADTDKNEIDAIKYSDEL